MGLNVPNEAPIIWGLRCFCGPLSEIDSGLTERLGL